MAGRALGRGVSIRDVFEAPTPAGLAARLAGDGAGASSIEPRGEVALAPASAAQTGLFLEHRITGPSPTYNIPTVLDFPEVLDADVLARAAADVVERHPVLRTVLRAEGGAVVQDLTVVPTLLRAGARIVEARTVGQDGLEAATTAVVRHAFDLSGEAPLKVALLTADGAPGSRLVLVLHHAAGDGASVAVLVRDLAAAYAARRAGRSPRCRSRRCATRTTQPGRPRRSATATIRAASGPGAPRSGGTRSTVPRSRRRCPPTAPTRPSPGTTATRSTWRGRRPWCARPARRPARTARACSCSARRPWRSCSPRSAPATTW